MAQSHKQVAELAHSLAPLPATLGVMACSAPRYDVRILDAIQALDDREKPIAQVCREVGGLAEQLGVPRPSYVHVRRLVHDNRARDDAASGRRTALRRIADDVATDLVVGRFVHPYDVAGRVRSAGR